LTSDDEQPAYRFARGILRPTLSLLTRRDWRGQEHLPSSGGCVVVTNHISHADPLTFAHYVNDAGRAPRFLGKSEVFQIPVLGRIVAAAGQIPVYRETVDAAKALRAAIDAVYAGECVVIYPEATLTRDPDLWPMVGKTGAARIALTTGCPVIPVAQWGPQQILGPYQRFPRLWPRQVVHVWAGPPVPMPDIGVTAITADVLTSTTSTIMAAIVQLLAEIRGETAPAELFDPRAHTDVPRIGNPSRARRREQEGR
jgi:1-acyl-sn-glycerol-3-phosphate acyltransferase